MEELKDFELEEVSGGKSRIKGRVIIINCNHWVNVRSGAGKEYSKIGRAYLNDEYEYYGTSGSWYIIRFKGGKGYVHHDYISIIKG